MHRKAEEGPIPGWYRARRQCSEAPPGRRAVGPSCSARSLTGVFDLEGQRGHRLLELADQVVLARTAEVDVRDGVAVAVLVVPLRQALARCDGHLDDAAVDLPLDLRDLLGS